MKVFKFEDNKISCIQDILKKRRYKEEEQQEEEQQQEEEEQQEEEKEEQEEEEEELLNSDLYSNNNKIMEVKEENHIEIKSEDIKSEELFNKIKDNSDDIYDDFNLSEIIKFLPDLKQLDIEEDSRIFDLKGYEKLLEEREKFKQLRNIIKKEIDDYKKLFYFEEPKLICDFNGCNDFIGNLKSLENTKNGIFYRINGYTSAFMDEVLEEELDSITVYMTIVKDISQKNFIPFNFSGKKFIRCKNPNGKSHVFGISDEEGRPYISKDSQIKIINY